jgi:hypothetical protein
VSNFTFAKQKLHQTQKGGGVLVNQIVRSAPPYWLTYRKEIHKMTHSFLMIGQSNMAGRGFLTDAAPLDTNGGRLMVLRNGRWQRMYRPVNPDRHVSGTCLAESFAKAYSDEHPDIDVGIIPCADGGTSLSQWEEGGLLFDYAVSCAKLAMRTSRLGGILWHQGEGEAKTPELASSYAARFFPIVQELRKELNLPEVPFLVGGLGDFLPLYTIQAEGVTQHPALHGHTVNAVLEAFAAEQPFMGFVPATGLTPNPDNLHFSAKALHEFGLRYFAVYQKIVDPSRVIAAEASVDDSKRSFMEAL